jgi:hypothetical protein
MIITDIAQMESFNSKLKQCISPLYQIAANQGFQIVDKLF